MFCTNCGKELTDGWTVCPYCGNQAVKNKNSEKMSGGNGAFQSNENNVPQEYKMQAYRRSGRFSFASLDSVLSMNGSRIHADIETGSKRIEKDFMVSDIADVSFSYRPEWRVIDWIRIVIMAVFLPFTYGLSVIAIALFVKMACTQHLKMQLKDGRIIYVPVCQKGDAADFLRAIHYPEAQIQEWERKSISTGAWSVREWVITIIWLIIAAFGIYFGLRMNM